MNFEALFLGPKAENRAWFKHLIIELLDEHLHWRRNFHTKDPASITREDQNSPDFLQTQQRVENLLYELSGSLRFNSLPSHSPRYAAHMMTDLLIPAQIAYITTMLYNPNNVCWEASPVTTNFEIEAGKYFAKMLGFCEKSSYGHITSGGTIANLEALWLARNMKSIPFAIKKVAPNLVEDYSDFQLQNLSLEKTLELVDLIPKNIEELKNHSVRGIGLSSGEWKLGKVFAPRTKHYSWNKALDVLGLGVNNLIYVDVEANFRLSIKDLKNKVKQTIENKEPILMIVGVLGSTEEGAVDPLHEILALRNECFDNHGVWFWIHVDAAYGGYSASLVRDENYELIPREKLIQRLHDDKIIDYKYEWPSPEIYAAYAAVGHFNSVTIDPHKLGYIPYQAGGIVVSDKRVQNLVSFFATYIFQVLDDPTAVPLGSYILEGSKAGATAAAVWMSFRCVPGNISGYGKIIGESFEGTNILYNFLKETKNFDITQNLPHSGSSGVFLTRKFSIFPLNQPDTNLVVFVVNEDGNTSLARLNEINGKIRDATSPKIGRNSFTFEVLLSSTSFTLGEYGNCPKPLLKNIGIDEKDWDEIGTVTVLRSTLMSPYTTPDYTTANYEVTVVNGIKKVIQELVDLNEI